MGWSCSWSTVYIPQKGLLRMSNIWSWGILCREDCKFHLLFHFSPPLFLRVKLHLYALYDLWRVILHCNFAALRTELWNCCSQWCSSGNFRQGLLRLRLISYKILIILDIWDISCWWNFYEAISEGPSPISLLFLITNQKCQKGESLYNLITITNGKMH